MFWPLLGYGGKSGNQNLRKLSEVQTGIFLFVDNAAMQNDVETQRI